MTQPINGRPDLTTNSGDAKVLGVDTDVPVAASVNGSGLFVNRDDSTGDGPVLRQPLDVRP